MKDRITLSTFEQRRLLVLNHLLSAAISITEAAGLLGISERQVRRLLSAYRADGAAALAHGNRGRHPANAIDAAVVASVVALATTTYVGFNHHHLTEMLAEHEGLAISRSTVRRILVDAGVPSPRRRRPPRHRQRRDRYPREGMLLQVDASRHDWLEGRGPWLSLVGAIDDATGLVPWACFREQEDAHGYFQVLRHVVRRHGIPLALYSDRHSIFVVTKKTLSLDEQLAGGARPTQFGRLLGELGVQLILARSPQAKGRVERLWGTFQDRLGSELRLAGASTRADAEQVLARYLPKHNRRFIVPAADTTPAWLPWPATLRLDEVFCFKYQRIVDNDNTVRLGERCIDIPAGRARLSFARARVEVHQRFDGTLRVYYRGTCVAKATAARQTTDYRVHHPGWDSPPGPEPHPIADPAPPPAPKPPWRPARQHPWQRSFSPNGVTHSLNR